MNEILKVRVGKKVTVFVSVIVEGNRHIEYIQGVLKDVIEDVVIVTQHIPFYNLLEDGETIFIDRHIPGTFRSKPIFNYFKKQSTASN